MSAITGIFNRNCLRAECKHCHDKGIFSTASNQSLKCVIGNILHIFKCDPAVFLYSNMSYFYFTAYDRLLSHAVLLSVVSDRKMHTRF